MPRVSVIIPNYNHEAYLAQRIESVLDQTFNDIEVIILDDCSSDHSREIIARYAQKDSRIRMHFNEENTGSPFSQWNRGVEMALGEYIWIAESDDYCENMLLERLIPVLGRHENVSLAYAQTIMVDERGEKLRSYLEDYRFLYKDYPDKWARDFIAPGKETAAEFMISHNIIPNASAVLMRKSAYKSAGGAIPGWKLNGDWMFYTRLMMEGDIAFVAEPLNYFRQHEHTQRHRSNLTPIVYQEILHILQFIETHAEPDDKKLLRARRKVARWWGASLFRQRWTKKNAALNRNLFFRFLRWKPWLPLGLIAALFFYTLSNLTTWLGVKGKLRAWINRIFPGLLFSPKEIDDES